MVEVLHKQLVSYYTKGDGVVCKIKTVCGDSTFDVYFPFEKLTVAEITRWFKYDLEVQEAMPNLSIVEQNYFILGLDKDAQDFLFV